MRSRRATPPNPTPNQLRTRGLPCERARASRPAPARMASPNPSTWMDRTQRTSSIPGR